MILQRFEILHDHTQSAHTKPISHALAIGSTIFYPNAVVETLLSLTPVTSLCQVWSKQLRVYPTQVILGNIRLQDLWSDEENIAELA